MNDDAVVENGNGHAFNNGTKNGHAHNNGFSNHHVSEQNETESDDDEPLTGNEKATTALGQLGLPIVQGALSTILAVCVLADSPDYIHRTFFKVIFLVMCFGFYHAMVVIPVVLSLVNDCWAAVCGRRSRKH